MKNLFIVRSASPCGFDDYFLTDSIELSLRGMPVRCITEMCANEFEEACPHLKLKPGHYHRVGISSRKPKTDVYYELTFTGNYHRYYSVTDNGKIIGYVSFYSKQFRDTGREITEKLYFHVID